MKLKKLFKEEGKYILLLNLLVLVMLGIYFAPSFFSKLPLTYGTDIRTQSFPFYEEFRRKIFQSFETRTLPFYSWSTFLGTNYWASKAFYIVGDPYNYLGLLFKWNFFDLARNLSVLKFLVGANGFYLLLSRYNGKPISKVMCSLAYTFSSWAIFFSGQLIFLSFYSFVPYYLLAVEKYLQDRHYIMYGIMSGLLFGMNYYFFYSLSLFTVIYFTYRYFQVGLEKNMFWKRAIFLICIYILGSFITSFLWIPAVMYVLGVSRFSNHVQLLYSFKVYMHIIYSFFVPNYLYIYRYNLFDTNNHFTREICLYISSLIVFLPQYFKLHHKKDVTYLYLCLSIILLIPSVSSAAQGFGDASFRWVYLIGIMNLIHICYVIDNFEMIDQRLLKVSGIVACLLIGGTFATQLFKQPQILNPHTYVTIIFMILYLVLGVIGTKLNRKILLVIVFLELGISGLINYQIDIRGPKSGEDYNYIDQLTHVLESYPGQLKETIEANDDSAKDDFYRIYVPLNDGYWDYSNNLSMLYDIRGLMTYDSTFAPSFLDMYRLSPDVNQYESDWVFNIEDRNLMDYLNVKYAVVKSGTKLDKSWEVLVNDYNYGLTIYKNNNYRPLGVSYNKKMTTDEYKRNNNTHDFLEYVISDEDINVKDGHAYTHNTYLYPNSLTSLIDSEGDSYMVLTIPYDKGWKVLIDGQEIEYQRVGGGFIGIEVPNGQHSLEMYFVPQGFKLGVILSIIGIITLIFSKKILHIINIHI